MYVVLIGHSNHAIIDHADIGASETQHIGREQHTEVLVFVSLFSCSFLFLIFPFCFLKSFFLSFDYSFMFE